MIIRIILSFAAGFAAAKIFSDNSSMEKVKKAAKDKTEKIKTTSKKVAQIVKEEFGKKKPDETTKADETKEDSL